MDPVWSQLPATMQRTVQLAKIKHLFGLIEFIVQASFGPGSAIPKILRQSRREIAARFLIRSAHTYRCSFLNSDVCVRLAVQIILMWICFLKYIKCTLYVSIYLHAKRKNIYITNNMNIFGCFLNDSYCHLPFGARGNSLSLGI